MNRKSLIQAAVLLLAVGGAFVTLQQTDLLPAYILELKVIGAIGAIGGLLCIAIAAAVSASPAMVSLVFRIRSQTNYVTEQATIADLDILFDHYKRIFGSDLIPKEEFTKWMAKNPSICHKVLQVKSYGEKTEARIAGFFDFEPLTSRAYKRLLRGPIEGWGLSEKDILSSKARKPPQWYYIGSIGTTTTSQQDKAATLFGAIEHLRRTNATRPITLLTNPLTQDGLRLCKGFEFKPVDEAKPRGVWVLELPKAVQVPRYERKLLKALVDNV